LRIAFSTVILCLPVCLIISDSATFGVIIIKSRASQAFLDSTYLQPPWSNALSPPYGLWNMHVPQHQLKWLVLTELMMPVRLRSTLRNASALSVYMRVIPNLEVRIFYSVAEMISSRACSRRLEHIWVGVSAWSIQVGLNYALGHWDQTTSHLSQSPQ